jgi:hypothetical protein
MAKANEKKETKQNTKKREFKEYVIRIGEYLVTYPTTLVQTSSLESVYESLFMDPNVRLTHPKQQQQQQQEQQKNPNINTLFGEIQIAGMRSICALSEMKFKECGIFADMGCGFARQLLFVFLEYTQMSVIGVEYDIERFRIALRALEKLSTDNPATFQIMDVKENAYIKLRSVLFNNTIEVFCGNLLHFEHTFQHADVLFCEVSFNNTGQRPLLSKRLSQMKRHSRCLLYEDLNKIDPDTLTKQFGSFVEKATIQTSWSPTFSFSMYLKIA